MRQQSWGGEVPAGHGTADALHCSLNRLPFAVRGPQIMRVGVLFAVAAFVALTLSGCSNGSNLPPLPQADNSETAYHLGAGDKLRVTVFGAEDLSGDFSVADNGILSFPLIGDVKAAGLTPGQ